MAVTCVEEAVQGALIAASGVTALVPAERIKIGTATQKQKSPYIVHFPVAGSSTQLLAEFVAFKIWEFYQLSIFADSYSSGKAVCLAVESAIGRLTTSDGVELMLMHPARFMGFDADLVGADSSLSMGSFHFVMEFRIGEAL